MKDMMQEFVKYAKKQFGYDISLTQSSTPDTFESLFGASFIQQDNNDFVFCEQIENIVAYSNTVARVNYGEEIYKEDNILQLDLTLAA